MKRSVWMSPFNTLTGRLVAVTIAAVIVSYAIALVLFSNERGSALRRAAETSVVERVAYTADRLRAAPVSQRAAMALSIRDFGVRYYVNTSPSVTGADQGDAGARIAKALSDRLGVETRARSRTVDVQPHYQRHQRPPGGDEDAFDPPTDPGAPVIQNTEVTLSVDLGGASWLNARLRLPGPRPAPLSVLIGGFIVTILVGAGAVLISRQIGRPLADLADAARALGSGETNVTAPVSGPDDVRRASTAFNAMAERLGRQLSRQRQMLWALSHDLRTPITALRLRAELIEDESTKQHVLAPIEEMERLTEQALSLARAGASEEERTRVDLSELVQTLVGELKDVGVNANADTPTPVFAECRPSEIARAVRNLAENAAKYGGGGIVRVYRDEAGGAVVEVDDDGPGVAEDQLGRITAPFYRTNEARSEASGAGLGLAIAQAIADGHGGKLVLANRQPHGLSVKLVLPA